MNVTIYKAAVSDADALLMLNEKFNGEGCATLERIKTMLAQSKAETVFIAKCDEKAVGFCCTQLFESMCYNVNYVEITELFVEEAYRGCGVGTKLIEFTEEYFSDSNVEAFQLFTGDENLDAQRFYEKLGYRKTDEIMYRKR
ncbi:MAG: GNAT family N-acetyltransferase [Clostridiales bacterium]|nr:GNAT family N-acetyltransferase [Clostridiales bacterium]